MLAVATAQDAGLKTQDPGLKTFPGFVEIPAGPFTMGATKATDPRAFDNEQPEATIDLPAFYIAQREVTVAEFTRFVQATQWPVDTRATSAPSDQPVTHVSWPDAIAYCRWLESTMKGTLPEGWRVALPSEAQWEKAARSGAAGLHDMVGSVWEWTRSPYQPYPYDESNDRANLDQDALWVMRGGGSADGPEMRRATTRGAAEPGARRPFIGFRVAISPK